MLKASAVVLLLAASLPAAELNVRNVVLYKHGVGYFERAGELSAGEGARLDFKAGEMNDVLKSLTVEVKGGASVAGLRYDSSEPLERRLGELPLKLEPQGPLAALLDQLKGAQLELKYGGSTIAGAIVSARLVPATRDQGEREQVTLLRDTGELQTLDLAGATSVRFPDPKLQLQLKDYLAVLTQARSRDKRSVYIDSSDTGRRQIVASYMIPVPVWKSSYRLILNPGGEPLLEGWAIVDNTTDEDWTNVRLALVSGRPISFVSNLYEPKYLERPVAELAEERPQKPVVHEGAVAMEAETKQMARRAVGGVAGGVVGGVAEVVPAAPAARGQLFSTVAETAQGRELGELFEYRFDKPVTVRKNESAMLPFLQQKIAARKLLIYSDHSSQHPMNAAELDNSTGKTLDGGPITVYDAAAYAGEALMETLKSGDKRLISYGIDLGTRITALLDSKQANVREVHLRRGLLTARSAIRETKNYTIRNVDSKAKTLVIEHPVRPGYKLLNQKPAETTTSAYRFEVKLAPSSTERFAVDEERVFDQTYAVASITPDFLLTLVQNKEISGEARKQLQAIADRKREIAETDRAIHTTNQQVQELFKDQERIRENLERLNRVAGQQEQVQKYARQLAAQEGELATHRDRLSELRRKKTALETDLAALIEKLEF